MSPAAAQGGPVLTLIEGPDLVSEAPVFLSEDSLRYAYLVKVHFDAPVVVAPGGTTELDPADFDSTYTDVAAALVELETNYGAFAMTKRYPNIVWGDSVVVNPRTELPMAVADLSQWIELLFDDPVPLDTVAAILKGAAEVEFVDAPYIYSLNVKPSDQYYHADWPFGAPVPSIDAAHWDLIVVEASEAWDLARGYVGEGNPVLIGLSDTFGETNINEHGEAAAVHPDLRSDPRLGGRLRLDNTAVGGSHGGHGATVAGFAGAMTDNDPPGPGDGTGASIAWTVALSGYQSGAVGIRQATCTLPRDGQDDCVPVDVLNMSWSMNDCSPDGPPDQLIDCGEISDALEDALGTATILTGSTGNEHRQGHKGGPQCVPCRPWPGGYYSAAHQQGVFTVNATRSDDTVNNAAGEPILWNHAFNVSPLSDPSRAFMDLSAPGINILILRTSGPNQHTMERHEGGGTSFSAPMVASLIALLRSINPELTHAQFSEALIRSAAEVGEGTYAHTGLHGEAWDPYYGYGRINAYRAVRYVIEHFGGRVGGTSDGHGYFITEPLTLHAGATLAVRAGTDLHIGAEVAVAAGATLEVEPGATLRFEEDIQLVVRGTLDAADALFTEAETNGGWDGLVLEAGSATLTGSTVEHADIGVTVYDPAWLHTDGSTFQFNRVGIDVLSPLNTGNQNRFEETIFNTNGVAIRSDFSTCVGATCSCLWSCRSRFSVTNSCVLGSIFDVTSGTPGHGVWALNADARVVGSTVLENDATGLLAENAVVRSGDTRLAFNGYGTTPTVSDGMQAGGDADLVFYDVFDATTGGNAVHQNAGDEVAGLDEGFVVLGAGFLQTNPPPSNSIWKTTPPASGSRYVANGDNAYTLSAQNVYWNSSSGPPSGAFEGLVASSPHATSNQASGAGNPECPSPSSLGERPSARGPAAMGGEGEARIGDEGPLWGEGIVALAEAIRDTRAAIRVNPLGSEAARLVRELYALQRLDRDDVLRERAATLELLAELRARLNLPALPAGEREPGEAALSSEVSDALLREDYELAASLVSGPGQRVEGQEVRRRLRYAELTLDLQARRFDWALARIDTLLAALPEASEGERRVLLDRAAVIAERQHGAQQHSPAATSLAGSSGATGEFRMALGQPNPNPARGSTALRLELPQAAVVRADVFDLLGRHIAMLADSELEAGFHILRVEGNRLAPGLYVVRATVSSRGTVQTLTQRVTLVR